MVCSECGRSDDEPKVVIIPKKWRKGVKCFDCYNDQQRISNRKSNAKKAQQNAEMKEPSDNIYENESLMVWFDKLLELNEKSFDKN
jgi:hypothetical protein